jgi:hypothetical protein
LHPPPDDVPPERRRPFIPAFNLGKRCKNPEWVLPQSPCQAEVPLGEFASLPWVVVQ